MLTALFVGILGLTGDQDVSVSNQALTYDNPGAPVEQVLNDLSSRSGIRLEASPVVQGDILVVHLRRATLRQSMDQIAWAVDGSWERSGDTCWLKRTSQDLRDEAKRELAYHTEFGRTILAQWRKDNEPAPMTEVKAAQMAKAAKEAVQKFNPRESTAEYTRFADQVTGQLPLTSVLYHVVNAMPPEELGQLPGGIEIVYSSDPNANQKPFPIDPKPLIARLRAEQQTWLDAIDRYSVSGPVVGGMSYEMAGVTDATSFDNLGRILVGFQRRSRKFPAIAVRIQAWSRTGKSLGQVRRYVYGRPPTPVVPELKGTTAFAATPAQKAIQRRNRASASGLDVPMEPSVVRQLVSANGIDPLALTTGESLVRLATLQAKNLVGCLDDSALLTVTVDKKGMVAPAQLLNGIAQEHEITADDKWLTFRPTLPSTTREFRTHRPTLRRYLARVATGESLGLEERATWAKSLPATEDSFLSVVLARLVSPPTTAIPISDDEAILHLYGSLDPGQRQRAKSSEGLSLAQLSDAQLSIVRKLVFGEHRLKTDAKVTPGGPVITNLQDLQNEPTEILAANWRQTGILKLNQQSEDAVLIAGHRENELIYPDEALSASELGWKVFQHKNPQLLGDNDGASKASLDRLQMGKRTKILMRILVAPETYADGTLEGWDVSERRWLTYRELPTAFRKKVEDAETGYAQSHSNRRLGTGNGPPTQSPPPPQIP